MAYSRFGHGTSDLPAAEHTTAFMHDEARLLPEILDRSSIDRAILFGHSTGGSIALIAAAEFPSRVHAMILEAPHVFVEDVAIASIERMRTLYAETDLRQRLSRHHLNPDAAFRGWNDVWLAPEFRSWNLDSSLPAVTCPTLLIQGELDRYGTLAQIEAIEQQVAGPVERLILADCGHQPHRDQRAAVLDAVDSFVKRVS
jgi:pimeloyl-ACP methyl ester carboxylesterase